MIVGWVDAGILALVAVSILHRSAIWLCLHYRERKVEVETTRVNTRSISESNASIDRNTTATTELSMALEQLSRMVEKNTASLDGKEADPPP
jgi:hypothetical protein